MMAFAFITTGQPTQAAADPIDVSEAVTAAGVETSSSTILVKRLPDGQVWQSNAVRASMRFSPASTAKIPHTLIAIESGIAMPGTTFQWDGRKTWNAQWNRDHSLATAFRHSVVWVYQEIVRRIGTDGMAGWMKKLRYGNEATGTAENLTRYWLDGTLRVSAAEQIDFLSRLADRRLSISPATYDRALDVMLVERGESWTLYGKSGWRHAKDIMDIGWYVGWLRCAEDTYVFAMNLDMPDTSYLERRQSAVRAVLTKISAFNCE